MCKIFVSVGILCLLLIYLAAGERLAAQGGFGVSQTGGSFCSSAEVAPVVLKYHIHLPALDFAFVPSQAARNLL